MKLLLYISGWIVCSVLAYIRLREGAKEDGAPWTLKDRIFSMIFSFMGPFGLFMSWFVGLDWDREVKW